MMEIKTCKTCGIEKDVSLFYKTPGGYRGECKKCTIKSHHKYQNDVSRAKKRAMNALNGRAYEPNNANRNNKATRKYEQQNPIKKGAHDKLNKAIKTGKIKANCFCEICGIETKTQAHHTDYSEPLIVVWVCRECHRDIHRMPNKEYVEWLKNQSGSVSYVGGQENAIT
jgi:hypothetical protein